MELAHEIISGTSCLIGSSIFFHGFSRAKFKAESAAKSPPCLSCFMRIAFWTQDLSDNKLRHKNIMVFEHDFPVTQPFWLTNQLKAKSPSSLTGRVKVSHLPNLPVLQLATHAICQHLHGRMLQDGGLAQLEEVRHLGLKVLGGAGSIELKTTGTRNPVRNRKVKIRCL